MRLTKLTQTNEANPAQWEGKVKGGRKVYIMYDEGALTVRIGETAGKSLDEVAGTIPILRMILGSYTDGSLTTERMLDLISGLETPQKLPAAQNPNGGKPK